MTSQSHHKIDELQKVLEDLGNHITIISGFFQISSDNNLSKSNKFVADSVYQATVLIETAISLVDEIKQY